MHLLHFKETLETLEFHMYIYMHVCIVTELFTNFGSYIIVV